MSELTLGSLFDGSGGFPLAGKLCGIKPVWASEIEPFPIRVTTKRIPEMKHFGDIRKLDGAKLPPVDIITFGSPCQNLSQAGDKEGIHGEKSGLFFEAIRIIKEMREATHGRYPKYIVWENVSGARSSNKGKDFQEVLRQICSIKEAGVSIPEPEKGKWLPAGKIVGDSFSLAWRQLDAQYWGVPQRRKRIFLVADFSTPPRAGKILFESEGLSGYSQTGFRAWQKASRDSQSSFDCTGCLKMFENHSQDSRYTGPLDVAETIAAKYGTGGNNQPLVVGSDGVRRLTPIECARLQGFPDRWARDLETEDPDEKELQFWHEVFESLGKKKTDKQLLKWLKDPHTDSAEYRMWGNGVALPCVWFVLAGIEYAERQNKKEKENL